MAVHIARPKENPDTPQLSALSKEYELAANPPPPTTQSAPLKSAASQNNSANVQAIGWDLFKLNLRQLREIKALGFDAVTLNCLWEDVQPKEGIWNWGEFARYVNDAQSAGLQLTFRGPFACPFWMGESFAMCDHRGKSSFSGKYGRVASFWNLDAQNRIDEFISRAWDALGLENFWALETNIGTSGECLFQSVRWNPDGTHDNEVPLWCFDEWALRAFRLAMRARYGDDLEALNRSAGQKWQSWSEVLPAQDVAAATYFGDTLAWYQSELIRYIDGMIHRLRPHGRIILPHAFNLDFAPGFWGAGSAVIEPMLWDLGAKWRERFVEIVHFHYSFLLTINPLLHYYLSKHTAMGKPQRAFAGVEYCIGAPKNVPLIQGMGFGGMICGVNDHLYQFAGGVPTKLNAENARGLAQAIEKFKENSI